MTGATQTEAMLLWLLDVAEGARRRGGDPTPDIGQSRLLPAPRLNATGCPLPGVPPLPSLATGGGEGGPCSGCGQPLSRNTRGLMVCTNDDCDAAWT
jgi:hypothetical protein